MMSFYEALKTIFSPRLKIIISESELRDVLEQIRETIVTTLLRLCAILGVPAVFFGSIPLYQEGVWGELIVGNGTLVVIIYLAIKREINYQVRSIALVALAYLFLISSFWGQYDELSLANLFAFVVMTTLLLGRRGSIVATILSLVTLLFLYWQSAAEQLLFRTLFLPYTESPVTFWATITSWIFYVGIFLFTMWVYLDGFQIAWEREHESSKLLQQERDRLAQALEREHMLLQELEKSYQRESDLSQLKSKIITTVSHEFRTPLAIINTSVDLFVQYGANITPQKQSELQKRIHNSVFYLTDLIQDISLIDTANTEGITIVPTTYRFASLCRALEVNLVAELGRPSNLTFQYDIETNETVTVDYNHLQQVLLNLVVNALKYSAESQMVTVRLSYSAQQLEIAVIDNGIGIFAEDIERIWEVFYRGRNVETRRGLGLGLHIVKRVITAMGGEITAASAGENQGSTFTITIPQEEMIEGDGEKALEPEKP